MNGVISDFDKENFDESFGLSVKCAIMLPTFTITTCAGLVATPRHVHITHTSDGSEDACFVPH